jgi:NAD(P)-dependent dehydrogenase (short-subunit alcohol dehydrogenase family)
VFLKDEDGIRVNCICPGGVATEIHAHAAATLTAAEREGFDRRRVRINAGRTLTPDEVAEGVIALIRDDTINGAAYRLMPGRPWELL